MRDKGHMARINFAAGGAHALGIEALKIRVQGI
jgi:hypothetical protein